MDNSERLGRPLTVLKAPWEGTDRTYSSIRLGEQTQSLQVSDADYSHCTFVDVSFMGTEFSSSEFKYCTFVRCYFRDAKFSRTAFTGARFEDCIFDKISLHKCDFRYAHFRRTAIPFSRMNDSLPSESNLREAVSSELEVAALSAGARSDARHYRLEGIDARGRNLRDAVFGGSEWHREHYSGGRQVQAAGEWVWYLANRGLWRHGESAGRLLLMGAIVCFVVFPAVYALVEPAVSNLGAAVTLSVSNFIPVSVAPNVADPSRATIGFAITESILGLVFSGLLLTTIIKALSRK